MRTSGKGIIYLPFVHNLVQRCAERFVPDVGRPHLDIPLRHRHHHLALGSGYHQDVQEDLWQGQSTPRRRRGQQGICKSNGKGNQWGRFELDNPSSRLIRSRRNSAPNRCDVRVPGSLFVGQQSQPSGSPHEQACLDRTPASYPSEFVAEMLRNDDPAGFVNRLELCCRHLARHQL